MTDLEIKQELLESSKWFDSEEGATIKKLLKDRFPAVLAPFILHHHFEQADEHYIIMINGQKVVELEVSGNDIVEFEASDINEYLRDNKKMPKLFRRRFEIARDLST